ncbi:hypothetical protein PVAND_015967 [Polypedilum vanderplanki]|uniref:Uncharacterized protein n=1 Tax=Polypedilum vanderplanki TaxID=319348 RepID=A0A9J6BE84_POLVA|nr:hypothetical protein PVAND_015967 [Polypedilum vanderplanki]
MKTFLLLIFIFIFFINSSIAIYCDFNLDLSNSDYICEFSNSPPFNSTQIEGGPHLNETQLYNDEQVTVVRSNFIDQLTVYEELTDIFTTTFINLKILRLNHVKMIRISPTAFGNCANLVEIDLSDNYVSNIPASVFGNCNLLTTLKLSRNNFTEIGLNALNGLQSLKFLSFNGNQLTKIEKNIFDSLANLIEVNFSNNFITSIDSDVFIDLTKLRKIDFSNNQLTEINLIRNYGKVFDFSRNDLKIFNIDADIEELNLENNDFTSIPKINFEFLKVLKLSGNFIGFIDENSLKYARNLEILDLSTCGIYEIYPYSFFTLDKLRSLNLQHNKLQYLNGIFQPNLQNLEILDLSSNNLELLQHFTFVYLKSLKNLKLSHNKIENFMSLKHGKFENLEQLDLSGNSLTTLRKFTSESKFSKLTEIDLSYNQIDNIEKGFFDKFPILQKLNLNGNNCATKSSNLEECFKNFESITETPVTSTESYTEEPETSIISPRKELVLTIFCIIGVAVMLLGLIWYIHKLMLVNEEKKKVKHVIFEKSDMNYQRF